MEREVREVLQEIEQKREQGKSLMEAGDVAGAEAMVKEIESLSQKVTLLEQLQATSQPAQTRQLSAQPKQDDAQTERDIMFKIMRGGGVSTEERAFLEKRAGMTGATPEDGGVVIPQDISTQINELARQFDSLENYVNTQLVGTRSGSRVLEKLSDIKPFPVITEGGTINETDNPQFTTVEYTITDFAGILPISRTLLADTDTNLLSYVVNWLGNKVRVTRNLSILEQLKQLTSVSVSGLAGIKDIFNVTLDPAIRNSSIVLTNQDGFNYLDQLKDEFGHFILQPDPTQQTQSRLFGRHPVVTISNRFLPSEGADGEIAPMFMGDLTQAVVLFLRDRMEFLSTNIGGNAFLRNTLDLRVILRHTAILWDTDAAVYGKIDTTDLPTV